MSRHFDGSDDVVLNSNSAMSAYPFTLVSWFNADTVHKAAIIYDASSVSESVLFGLRVDNTGSVLKISIQSTTSNETNGTNSLSTLAWHNGAGVWRTATDREVFVAGVTEGTNATSQTYTAGNRLGVGRIMRQSPLQTFDGKLAFASVWTVDIGVTNLLALAHGVCPFVIRNDAQVRFYPLWGNQDPEPEYMGQFNGTVTGATRGANNPPVELIENYL